MKTRKVNRILQAKPVWYHPTSPIGSAVRYIASLTSDFTFVEIVVQTRAISKFAKKKSPLSFHLGKKRRGKLHRIPIENCGELRLQYALQSDLRGDEITQQATERACEVVKELGELWPA